MRKFFLSMVTDGDNSVSSKRVIAVYLTFFVSVCIIADLCNKRFTVSQFIFFGVLSLIAACLGLNTIKDYKAMDVKSDVASDVVKEQPGAGNAQDAKDILNSEKP